ncbi:WLM-domain-containing protein [Atractiella rhizophila]|nr:WLM-domain-containing protein [Atractiella rhizophila]
MSAPSTQVLSIRALKNRPRADEALELLKKIASLVKPIMKKHGWTLPELVEFFPENPGLLGLNVNHGQKICIRLRPAHSPNSFYDLETDLIGTMLHELTHNVHGPHDQKFYAYLDKLQDEYDALRSSGYSGEGFQSNGKRLGQGVGNDRGVSLDQARKKAAEMAEKRRKLQGIMGTEGRKLGGSRTLGKSPRQMAAEAAERRMKDATACGHGDSNLDEQMQREVEKAAAESTERQIIDLDPDDEAPLSVPDTRPIAPPTTSPASPSSSTPSIQRAASTPSSTQDRQPKISTASRSKPPPIAQGSSGSNPPRPTLVPKSTSSSTVVPTSWACSACTFLNTNPLALQCEICTTVRPSDTLISRSNTDIPTARVLDDEGWFCHRCSLKNDNQFWSCGACSAIKLSS